VSNSWAGFLVNKPEAGYNAASVIITSMHNAYGGFYVAMSLFYYTGRG